MLEAIIQYGINRPIYLRPINGDLSQLWTLPVAYLILTAPLAVAVAVAVGSRPSRRRLVAGLAVVLYPPVFAVLTVQHLVGAVGYSVLALGIVTAVARWLVARSERGGWTGVRPALAAVLVVPAIAAATWAIEARSERGRLAVAGRAAAEAPNLLLVVWDTVRGMNTSLLGYPLRTTPGLERLAREAVSFDWAFSTSPWTLPSHGSMFTGRYPQEFVAGLRRPLGSEGATLAEVLTDLGYRTSGFVANLTYTGYQFGIDRGFQHFEDYPNQLGAILGRPEVVTKLLRKERFANLTGWHDHPGRKRAADINRDFLRWLDRQPDAPFFAFLNYYDAHDPYRPPAPFDTAFGADSDRRTVDVNPESARRLGADLLDKERRAYDGGIGYLDWALTSVLDSLARRGTLDRTVVIVTSDHGEHFGERGQYYHRTSLDRELLHVPLVIRYPAKAPGGRRVATPVSLRDLAATALDLVGLPARMPGTSLRRVWEASGDSAVASPVIAGFADWGERPGHAIIADGKYFIEWPSKPMGVYRFPADVGHQRNLGSDPAFARDTMWARARFDSLAAVVRRTRDRLSESR